MKPSLFQLTALTFLAACGSASGIEHGGKVVEEILSGRLEAGRGQMKANSLQTLSLVALLGIGFVADAAAHNPTGRRRTGTIETVDASTMRITFRADREATAKIYVWNKRTRFVREISFVEASALRSGARADVTVHSPFFGEPFVSRVILLQPAPTARSRQ